MGNVRGRIFRRLIPHIACRTGGRAPADRGSPGRQAGSSWRVVQSARCRGLRRSNHVLERAPQRRDAILRVPVVSVRRRGSWAWDGSHSDSVARLLGCGEEADLVYLIRFADLLDEAQAML